jgi:hypothetical protein
MCFGHGVMPAARKPVRFYATRPQMSADSALCGPVATQKPQMQTAVSSARLVRAVA